MNPRSLPKLARSKSREDSKHGKQNTKRPQEKHQKLSPSIKPLAGKVFYLDLPANKRSETLENDIKTLGGTVEKFFSKDIRYLVSSKPEARFVHRLAQESPVPSPESGVSSPRPSSSKDGGLRGSSHGQPEPPAQVSRGRALLEKVVKGQERFQMNKMFSDALEWGVKILHVEDIMAYLEKKRPIISSQKKPTFVSVKKNVKITSGGRTSSQKHSVRRLREPFLKVEDSSQRFRPLYLQMTHVPVCNVNTVPPDSPFQTEEKKRQSTHGAEKHGKSKQKRKEWPEKRRSGFCECCGVNYDELEAHLKGERHQSFVADTNNYRQLDDLIAELPKMFIEMPPAQRAELSVSTEPACVPVASDQMEEAAENREETRVEERQGQQSLTAEEAVASCSSTQKRGRESPSPPNRDLSGEAVDLPETPGSKQASYVWGLCPSLYRAMAASSPLQTNAAALRTDCSSVHGVKGSPFHRVYGNKRRTPSGGCTVAFGSPSSLTAGAEPSLWWAIGDALPSCSDTAFAHAPAARGTDRSPQRDRDEGSSFHHVHRNKTPSGGCVSNQKHADSPGSPCVPRLKTGTSDRLLHQETWAELMQDKPVRAIRQNSIQEKTVEHTKPDFTEEKTAYSMEWVSTHRLGSPVSMHTTLCELNSQQELLQGEPVDSHPQQQPPTYIKRVNGTPCPSSQEDPAHRPESLPCGTDGPTPSKRRSPKRKKRRSGHCKYLGRSGKTPVRHATATPNPTDDTHSEAEDWAAVSPFLRKASGPRRRNRSQSRVSAGSPSTATEQAAEGGNDVVSGMYLLELFQDDEEADMQDDFFGFVF